MPKLTIEKIRNFFRHRRHRPSTKEKNDDTENKTEDKTEDKKEKEESEYLKNHPWEDEVLLLPLVEGQRATYFHVGGFAKELLLHGFKLGAWHIICTTATNNGYRLSSFGEAYPDVKDVFGGIEVLKQIGDFSLSQSWLTTREFMSELMYRVDSFYGNLHTTIGTKDGVTFKAKLKCGFEQGPVKAELVVPIYKEPFFMGYVVAEPVKNCQLGYRTIYNFCDRGFDMHSFCLGYYNGRTELGIKLENFKNLKGSIFHRLNERWAFALKTSLYSSENVKQFAIGGQYDFGNGILLKLKIREDTRLGFVYQSQVSENINIMYHLGFDLAHPISGAHKIAASLEFHC